MNLLEHLRRSTGVLLHPVVSWLRQFKPKWSSWYFAKSPRCKRCDWPHFFQRHLLEDETQTQTHCANCGKPANSINNRNSAAHITGDYGETPAK